MNNVGARPSRSQPRDPLCARLIAKTRNALDRGDLDKALAHRDKVLAKWPEDVEALRLAAMVETRRHQHQAALQYLSRALKFDPRDPRLLNHAGSVLSDMEQWEQAEKSYRTAIALDDRYWGAHNNLGNLLRERGDLEAAEDCLRRALELDPDSAIVRNNLGRVYEDRRDWPMAAAFFRAATELAPDLAQAHAGLSSACQRMGDLNAARDAARRACELAPWMAPKPLYALSQAKRFQADDPDLALFRAAERYAAGWSIAEGIPFAFARGKAMDDLGRYDEAFGHFAEANALKYRQMGGFNIAQHDDHIEQLRTCQDRTLLERLHGAGDRSNMPIFIIGMPRSGTTLMEQIIASHPGVSGAGERSYFLDAVREVLEIPGDRGYGGSRRFAERVDALTPAQCREIGRRYVERLSQHAEGAARVTDKLPGNFQHLGLIRVALPNARIIHCMRDPVDTCLSCYQTHFQTGHHYANDLRALGGVYRGYLRLMAHWRSVEPHVMLEVRYEALVDNPEPQARQVIEWLGLPWDERCLDFHHHTRAVETASAWQVRQPIYKRSVERWRRYESHLQPLLDTLNA